jgi:hypothetical protein
MLAGIHGGATLAERAAGLRTSLQLATAKVYCCGDQHLGSDWRPKPLADALRDPRTIRIEWDAVKANETVVNEALTSRLQR